MSTTAIYLDTARATLTVEQAAVESLASRIDHNFVKACELIERCVGRVVVCGVGKSGHIAHKIAATFASTGTVAFALHPTEAAHGDLGMIGQDDIVIAISYSGGSDELINILPSLRRKKNTIIAMTADAGSMLAQSAHVRIDTSVEREACPHNLAPTASTTATLVLGDMLAMALMASRGFSREDFARSHPAGRLGKLLTLLVKDIMHKAPNIPVVNKYQPLDACLLVMTEYTLGMIGIIDDDGILVGVFTDGDLRRVLGQQTDWRKTTIDQLMTRSPVTIDENQLAAEALHLFREKKINGAFVTDNNNRPVGVFNMHDLLQHGIVVP